MGKRLFYWELVGFIFVSALGTLLHFVYDWSGGSVWAAVISAVNESTWEHMKLLFFPTFLYTMIQFCVQGHRYPNLLAVRAVSTLAGLGVIPVLYYTYTGVLGRQINWLNIGIFFVAALVLFWLDFRLLEQGGLPRRWQQVAGLLILLALAMLFVYFTFAPPTVALWRDPVTGSYGI